MDDIAEPCAAGADGLQQALLNSRQRWRDFGAIATDLAFETDCEGRLSFIAPDWVLGWNGADLLGQRAARLLADQDAALPDPFQFAAPMRQRATWMRHADGGTRCLSLSVAPRLDARGRVLGLRGVGVDVTERERRDSAAAAALRRAELLDSITAAMRQEVVAPRMMQAVLAALVRALGADGAAILDLTPGHEDRVVLHHACAVPAAAPPPALLPVAVRRMQAGDDEVAACAAEGGLQLLTCPASTRFGDRAGLLAWRPADTRRWDADDSTLVASVTGVIRIVLEHEAIQRELALQARTDPLTGLLNRRAFIDETHRRIDRLDREGEPGTLIFIDLDRLKPLNDRLGHEAGDAALVLTAALLRRTFRPADLVARLGGDEFALWLDGSDELTAAERADRLRTTFPDELAQLTGGEAPGMSVSIGIACRAGGSGEDLDSVIQRADAAMYEVKRLGGAQWRVSHPERPR